MRSTLVWWMRARLLSIGDTSLLTNAALKPEQDADAEVAVNRGMLERAIGALNRVSPKLRFVVFPSGTKVSRQC